MRMSRKASYWPLLDKSLTMGKRKCPIRSINRPVTSLLDSARRRRTQAASVLERGPAARMESRRIIVRRQRMARAVIRSPRGLLPGRQV
jgi:hypothetical protein